MFWIFQTLVMALWLRALDGEPVLTLITRVNMGVVALTEHLDLTARPISAAQLRILAQLFSEALPGCLVPRGLVFLKSHTERGGLAPHALSGATRFPGAAGTLDQVTFQRWLRGPVVTRRLVGLPA